MVLYNEEEWTGLAYVEVHTADEAGGLGNQDGSHGVFRIRDRSEDLGFHGQRVAMLVACLGGPPLPLCL